MNYTEFAEHVDRILNDRDLSGGRWNGPYWTAPVGKGALPPNVVGLWACWETGGLSGGTCWDESKIVSYEKTEPPPEFKELDAVLEEVAPDLGFPALSRLKELVQTGGWTSMEYYGNQTDYSFRFIGLEALHGFLVDENALTRSGPSCK